MALFANVYYSEYYHCFDVDIESVITGWRRLIGSPKLQIISTKEPLNIGHFCRKWHIKIRDPMSLCHLVSSENFPETIQVHSYVWRDSFICDMYKWVMSHMNESCHIWMSHVTYEWVMSHMNESCHIWMSHVTYEWVMSHTNESCHMWMSHVICEWVTSHTNESCHIWMSRATHMHESCHIWMSCATHMNESCHIWMGHVTYEWVMSHMNESCYLWMGHVTYAYE